MDSIARFSSRVKNYVKYRPSYPPALLEFMTAELHLTPTAVIADVGAGTGKLTELFLGNGNPVYAVEPNEGMQKEQTLGRFLGPFRTRTFDNSQLFDFAGVKGRLLSSSYSPLPGHPSYGPMLAELQAAFDEYANNGRILFVYDCQVFYGQLAE